MTWLARLRLRLALWLAPSLDIAHGKRQLEAVLRECGVSKSQAVHAAARYFRELRREP